MYLFSAISSDLYVFVLLFSRYSPPQNCRKVKIQDIVKTYRHQYSVPDFYVSLFRNGVD